MPLVDISAILMGDPSARSTRPPTERERQSCRVYLRGYEGEAQPRGAARWGVLRLGHVITGLSWNKAAACAQWLRKHGRKGRIRVARDRSYQVERIR